MHPSGSTEADCLFLHLHPHVLTSVTLQVKKLFISYQPAASLMKATCSFETPLTSSFFVCLCVPGIQECGWGGVSCRYVHLGLAGLPGQPGRLHPAAHRGVPPGRQATCTIRWVNVQITLTSAAQMDLQVAPWSVYKVMSLSFKESCRVRLGPSTSISSLLTYSICEIPTLHLKIFSLSLFCWGG